jgi:hypothetical protein
MARPWALEAATNPSVVRVHVAHELTDRTIATSPPAEVTMPLAGLLEIDAVRTIDLHRYRARINLVRGVDRTETERHVREILRPAWGEETDLPDDAGPRAFESGSHERRVVAESAEMAAGHPVLEALFSVDGVSEAIAGDALVLVRLGRLFGWAQVQPTIRDVLAAYESRSRDGTP